MASAQLYLTVGALVTALFIIKRVIQTIRWNQKYKLPPIVPGVPFFGNMFQIPPLQQGPWAKQLAERYGEMFVTSLFLFITCAKVLHRFTLKFGGATWVFLNSSRVITDLMERRAAIYNSRPPFPMTQEIMSGESRIVLMPYNDHWRTLRKIMHQILSSRQQDVFKPFQDLESKNLCWDYLHSPDKWFSANARYANSVIMSVVFGRRSLLDDPDVIELFETIELFLENQQPGVNIVDSFPALNKLPKPLQWWRPRGERIFHKTAK